LTEVSKRMARQHRQARAFCCILIILLSFFSTVQITAATTTTTEDDRCIYITTNTAVLSVIDLEGNVVVSEDIPELPANTGTLGTSDLPHLSSPSLSLSSFVVGCCRHRNNRRGPLRGIGHAESGQHVQHQQQLGGAGCLCHFCRRFLY